MPRAASDVTTVAAGSERCLLIIHLATHLLKSHLTNALGMPGTLLTEPWRLGFADGLLLRHEVEFLVSSKITVHSCGRCSARRKEADEGGRRV